MMHRFGMKKVIGFALAAISATILYPSILNADLVIEDTQFQGGWEYGTFGGEEIGELVYLGAEEGVSFRLSKPAGPTSQHGAAIFKEQSFLPDSSLAVQKISFSVDYDGSLLAPGSFSPSLWIRANQGDRAFEKRISSIDGSIELEVLNSELETSLDFSSDGEPIEFGLRFFNFVNSASEFDHYFTVKSFQVRVQTVAVPEPSAVIPLLGLCIPFFTRRKKI